MGFWSNLLKYGGKATVATGKSLGNAVLHPSQTLRGAGNAVKVATVGTAVGYVGWEKLMTDKSIVRIVSDAVVGESATDAITDTARNVRDLKDKAGEAVEKAGNAMGDLGSKWNGMSNLLHGISSGNGPDLFGNFFSNLGRGNVSGLSIAGLVAAAFLIFGRFGWLGKIAGLMLGLTLIGNNANMVQAPYRDSQPRIQEEPAEEQRQGGMRR